MSSTTTHSGRWPASAEMSRKSQSYVLPLDSVTCQLADLLLLLRLELEAEQRGDEREGLVGFAFQHSRQAGTELQPSDRLRIGFAQPEPAA